MLTIATHGHCKRLSHFKGLLISCEEQSQELEFKNANANCTANYSIPKYCASAGLDDQNTTETMGKSNCLNPSNGHQFWNGILVVGTHPFALFNPLTD